MALETNAVTTYGDVNSIREDLIDKIYRVEPETTPFLSGVERGKSTAITHEWQTQALQAAAANAQLEGDAFTANTLVATARLTNINQISTKVARVTGSDRAVDHAGYDDAL